jgi:hypothetical protein
MFLLAAIAVSSAQSSVPAVQPQGNSQSSGIQTSPRIAPGSIPQQQPAWRPGQQIQPKPSPQVGQPQAQINGMGATSARPGTGNQTAVSASRSAAQPQGATVEPTTGASISWPGGVNRTPVVTASQPTMTNAAMMRPVNAPTAPNGSLPNGSMPAAQPMPGSTGSAGVDYRSGLLSVVAENAELGKLMRIIGNRTGAQIDVGADVANELVMAHLGPASPNEVLTALLDSSHLTYIMIGEDKVTKVVVRRRYSSAAPPVVARHRNLGFPEPTAESPTDTQPQEGAAQSDEIRPVGEMTPPPLPSRSPALRPGSPLLPGRAQSQDANGQPENVDVRAQVNGTEAPEQPESNPPQQ